MRKFVYLCNLKFELNAVAHILLTKLGASTMEIIRGICLHCVGYVESYGSIRNIACRESV